MARLAPAGAARRLFFSSATDDDWQAAPGTWSGLAWGGIEDYRILGLL
ncbi:MAG: hypothetical protein ACREHD_12320 [Pirellulales bacterium]